MSPTKKNGARGKERRGKKRMGKEERRKGKVGGEEKTKEKVERKRCKLRYNNIMELNFRC